jgi:hypothetical protein
MIVYKDQSKFKCVTTKNHILYDVSVLTENGRCYGKVLYAGFTNKQDAIDKVKFGPKLTGQELRDVWDRING